MSTDAGFTGAESRNTASADSPSPHATGSRWQRWRRNSVVIASVVALTLVVTLGFVVVSQGPRVVSQDVATDALVSTSAGRVVITLDQPVQPLAATAAQVTPLALASVASDGNSVSIFFQESLDYSTEYTVQIPVVSASTGAATTIEIAFETPALTVETLNTSGQESTVLARALSGGDVQVRFESETVVAEAGMIDQTWVTLQNSATGDGDTAQSIVSFAPIDAFDAREVAVPSSKLSDLRLDSATGLVGFIGDETLWMIDLSDPDLVPTSLLDEVVAWELIPRTVTFAALTRSGEVVVGDVLTGDLKVVASGQNLLTPVPGGQAVASRGDTGWLSISSDGTVAALAELTTTEGAATELVASPTASISVAADGTVATRFDGGETTVLAEPLTDTQRFGAACLSPGGQLLALEVISGDPDTPPSTMIVDAETGAPHPLMQGSILGWC